MNPTHGETIQMDIGTDSPALERFHRALSEIVAAERPDAYRRPITVAELYQDIAPYRRMRDRAGIEMHADYEHALLRLLAGENGYARLEPDAAREELEREAESADPNLSVYRKFAACDVWLMPGAAGAASSAPAATPGEEPRPDRPSGRPASPDLTERVRVAASTDAGIRAGEAEPPLPTPSAAAIQPRADRAEPTAEAVPIDPPLTTRRVEAAASPAAASPEGERCAFCGHGLPEHREVRFCPYCGGDQMTHPCGECGETLEEGWRYCVACGAAAGS